MRCVQLCAHCFTDGAAAGTSNASTVGKIGVKSGPVFSRSSGLADILSDGIEELYIKVEA